MIKKYKLFLENNNNIVNDIRTILTELTDEGIYCNVFGTLNKSYITITKIQYERVNAFTEKEFKLVKDILESINKYLQIEGYSLEDITCQFIKNRYDTYTKVYKDIKSIPIEMHEHTNHKLIKRGQYDLYYLLTSIKHD